MKRKCKHCKFFGHKSEQDQDVPNAKCRCKTNRIRNRIRNKEDYACTDFVIQAKLKVMV